MTTQKPIRAVIDRWPADGLAHGYERQAGESFDHSRSEALAWMLDQPEVLQWLWDHWRERGWIKFDGETWRAGDPDGTRETARAGRAGTAKAAREKLPASELLAALRAAGGSLTWAAWRAAAEERNGARLPRGPWAFYHAIKPLLDAGTVGKIGSKYVITDREATGTADETDPEAWILAQLRAARGPVSAGTLRERWVALGHDEDEFFGARASLMDAHKLIKVEAGITLPPTQSAPEEIDV